MFFVTIASVVAVVFGWEYNNEGNLDAFEKGDVLYRDTEMDLGQKDYHAGMLGKFYITADGKPALNVGHLNNDKGTNRSLSIDGVSIQVNTLKAQEATFWRAFSSLSWGGWDMYLREWELTVTSNSPHRKSTTKALQKAVIQAWGGEHSSKGWKYRGAFQNGIATENLALKGSKRDQILQQAFGEVPYWAGKDDWGYEFLNQVNYNGHWNTEYYFPIYVPSFRGLYDIDDVRCDFLPEWAYEKSGVPVWGADANLKWINGGTTDHAEYHNDLLDNNTGYTYDELSPMVQSGDFRGNGRDSRNRTTLRGAKVYDPMIWDFAYYPEGVKMVVGDGASTYVYFSILLYNRDGTLSRYAKDVDGSEYKYRKLYLSRDFGSAYSQVYYPTIFASDRWADYVVKLVVTDEGGNTTEMDYGGINPTLPVNLNIMQAIPYASLAPRVLDGTYLGPYSTRVYCRYYQFGQCFYDVNIDNNKFYFNGALAKNLSRGTDNIGEYIEVEVPSSATSGPLYYTLNGAQSNSINFTILPAIQQILPEQASEGEKISLLGHDFPETVAGVLFLNSSSRYVETTNFTRVSSTQVDVTVPVGAYTGVELVSNLSPQQYSYAPYMGFLVRPKITKFPKAIYQKRNFEIEGSGFGSNSEVWLGNDKLEIVSVSGNKIVLRATVGRGFGPKDLYVKNKATQCKYVFFARPCVTPPIDLESVSGVVNVDFYPSSKSRVRILLLE